MNVCFTREFRLVTKDRRAKRSCWLCVIIADFVVGLSLKSLWTLEYREPRLAAQRWTGL
jgi:hypothetical protein